MPRTFSPFDWKIVSGSNALIVSNVANIAELNLPIPKSVSLDTSTTLTYYFQTGDGNSVDLILGENPNEPQSVLRGFSPGNYSYDLGTSELPLHEPADKASTVKWTIIP
ncbi:MAG TPA: hypothetical protein EYF98_06345 [Planctomycetes bacterium]|nr:hypothetical protein [Planctomycetota bacterium]